MRPNLVGIGVPFFQVGKLVLIVLPSIGPFTKALRMEDDVLKAVFVSRQKLCPVRQPKHFA